MNENRKKMLNHLHDANLFSDIRYLIPIDNRNFTIMVMNYYDEIQV